MNNIVYTIGNAQSEIKATGIAVYTELFELGGSCTQNPADSTELEPCADVL